MAAGKLTLTLLAGPQSEEREVMAALRTYVRDEYKDKRQQDVDTSAWPILCAKPLTPVLTAHRRTSPAHEFVG